MTSPIACPPGCASKHELNESDKADGFLTHIWRVTNSAVIDGHAYACVNRVDQVDPPVIGQRLIYVQAEARMSAPQVLAFATALRAQALLMCADQVTGDPQAGRAFGDFVEAWLGHRELSTS